MSHINLDMRNIGGSAHNLAHEAADPEALAAAAVAAVRDERAAAGITAEWRHGGHALTEGVQSEAGMASGVARRATKAHKGLSSFLFTRHGQPLSARRNKLVKAAFEKCHLAAANSPAMAVIRNRLKTAATGMSTTRFVDGGNRRAIGNVLKQGTYREQLPDQFNLFERSMAAYPDIGPLHCSQIVQALDAGLIAGRSFTTAKKHMEELKGKHVRAEAEQVRAASESARASSSASRGAASASVSSASASARASFSTSSDAASASATSASPSACDTSERARDCGGGGEGGAPVAVSPRAPPGEQENECDSGDGTLAGASSHTSPDDQEQNDDSGGGGGGALAAPSSSRAPPTWGCSSPWAWPRSF